MNVHADDAGSRGAPLDGESGLVLARVTIAHGARRLVDDLSLAVGPGTVATVMGPSGIGKSTLLAFVAGTLPRAFRARGEIRLDGRPIGHLPPHARRVAILFQDDLLFPHMSVGENVAFGLPRSVRGRAARRREVEALLAAADLSGFADRDPATLSGGQRARVALVRTLASAPRLLLLDEPFGGLDAGLKERFRRFVFETVRARGLPTLLVTHDPADQAAAGGPLVTLGP